MKVILIILVIIFLSITSLFSIALISINKNAAGEKGRDAEIIGMNIDNKAMLPLSIIEIMNDIQRIFIDNPDNIPEDGNKTGIEDPGDKTEEEDKNDDDADSLSDTPAQDEDKEASQIDLQNNVNENAQEEKTEEEEDIKDGTIRFFLDGDMENGIYLGETTSNLESTEASLLYGGDFINTGFEFTIKNDTNLNLLPGSAHYIYIYFYTEESGWDYTREEINLSGEENCEKRITISIDKPEENILITDLQLISGWAVDLRNNENPGIKEMEIYLDGPRGYGKPLGAVQYGMPRKDVVDFLENQNYLNSGYQLDGSIDLEPGSTHTLFIYAVSSRDDLFNYEIREIFLSGVKEEKAIINAQINTQEFHQDNTIKITGWAIDKNSLEENLKEEQKNEDVTSGSGEGYSVRKLIFNSNRDGNENIFSINIDGTGLTRLTDSSGSDMYPEVSPDGNKIAYTSDIGGVWQIMIMDWDGKNKRQLTRNNFRSAYPSWSYDSKYIYFEAYNDGDWELYRIKSDGTEQKRLTFNPDSHDWHPNGHPGEYKIVYESGATGHENIYVMNHDGSGKIKLCGDDYRRRVPDVSSDGTRITYMRYTGKNCDIWIMNSNGRNETRLTDNSDEDGHPAFSPDDKYIVYEERKGSRENIILIDLATGKKTNITNSPYIDKDADFLYQQ